MRCAPNATPPSSTGLRGHVIIMRHHIWIAALALVMSSSSFAQSATPDEPALVGAPDEERLTSRDIGNWLRQAGVKPPKPGAGNAPSTRYTGNDTCPYSQVFKFHTKELVSVNLLTSLCFIIIFHYLFLPFLSTSFIGCIQLVMFQTNS